VKINYEKAILIFLLLLVCYFPLFLHLDSLGLYIYDEARLAINAIEMVDKGEWLTTYFDGQPDLWNTKPPLMIWLQAACIKIFGIGELALRLPAAISGLLTILFVCYFCWKILRRKYLGIFAALVLLTTPGYLTTQVTRTGDYDALLILFTTIFLLTIFQWIQSDSAEKKNKLLIIAAGALSLAVLSKSIVGLLFLPVVMAWIIWKQKLPVLLKTSQFYFGIGIFLCLVGGYYGFREFYNPGYLEAVWQNEIGGRYLDAQEDHTGPFSFFFKRLWEVKFLPWLFFLPLSLVFVRKEPPQIRSFIYFLMIAALWFLLVVSFSTTKLEWYDAPVYPLLAIVVALSIENLFLFFQATFSSNKLALLIVFGLAIFGMPYKKIISTIYLPSHTHSVNFYSGFIKMIPQHKKFTIVNEGYNAHIQFYKRLYEDQGYEIKRKFPSQLVAGETAMICEDLVNEKVHANFNFEILEQWRTCRLVLIK